MTKIYKVAAFWDEEAKVWVAEGVNVPGLCTEASTMKKLLKKLQVMVPEMLEANGLLRAGQKIPIELVGKISTVGHLHA